MMQCEEAGEWFGIYRDLPKHSEERLAVDRHVEQCAECAEQFKLWEESALLIQELPMKDTEEEEEFAPELVNQNVMNRIYAEQSWFMPAVRRTYSFSFSFRRNVAAILASMFALFACGFLYMIYDRLTEGNKEGAAMLESASAFSASHQSSGSVHFDVPLASLSDPIVLNVSPVMPEYWIALSIVGMIMTLLILNWFSRVRS